MARTIGELMDDYETAHRQRLEAFYNKLAAKRDNG